MLVEGLVGQVARSSPGRSHPAVAFEYSVVKATLIEVSMGLLMDC